MIGIRGLFNYICDFEGTFLDRTFVENHFRAEAFGPEFCRAILVTSSKHSSIEDL